MCLEKYVRVGREGPHRRAGNLTGGAAFILRHLVTLYIGPSILVYEEGRSTESDSGLVVSLLR